MTKEKPRKQRQLQNAAKQKSLPKIYHRKEACASMTAWHDPFGERIKANVRQCDRCGTELDEGDNAYFTGLDMLCLDCAEAAARAQAEQDTVETIQTRFHAMEQRGLTRRDIDALYDLLQDVMGDEESAIEDNLADMRVVLDEWGEGYVA